MTRNNSWNFDTTYSTGDLLYASSGSSLSKLAIGSNNKVLGLSSSLPAWTTSSASSINSQTYTLWEDFTSGGGLNGVAGQNYWTDVSTGTSGALTNITGYNNHPGVVVMNTGTSSSGYGEIAFASGTSGPCVVFGGGTLDLTFITRIPTLSTAAQEFSVTMGWRKVTTNSGANTDGAWFQYNRTTNSGKWTIRTMKASAATTANTNNTVDTSWHSFKISVNAGNTSIAFYIDDVEVSNSPIATNLPIVTLQPIFSIVKSAGSTSRSLEIDYLQLDINLTSARA